MKKRAASQALLDWPASRCIGRLTSNVTHTKSDDRVLILLRPTLLTPPPDNSLIHVLRMGAETRPLTPL